MRRCAAVLALTLLVLTVPDRAFAHGFGIRYDIPVPFWLYAYGAAAAVVLTFVLLVDTKPVPHRYPRFDLLRVGWFRAVFAGRPFLLGLRLLAVAIFSLIILSGLLGDQTPTANFAPTFVWIVWWVGLAFLTALVGNLWELVNPWKILPYPAGWGVWPALALYFGFAWVELVFLGSARPSNIAVLALLYSAITGAASPWGSSMPLLSFRSNAAPAPCS